MSVPVNVLAVMSRACTVLNDEGLFNPGDDLCKASAAVAALIKAARNHLEAYGARYDAIERIEAAAGLRAALANVGGRK